MKEKILELRAKGFSYSDICKELKCSKSVVSYHCGEGQKEKNRKRTQSRRKTTVISQRVERFQYDRKIKDKTEDFQRGRLLKNGQARLGRRRLSFRWQDVIDKFGWQTVCYLTGMPIDLKEPKTYQFDHIIPYSKGGEWTLENLGIACKDANQAKADMTVDEFISLCKMVLEHNGYTVKK
jgi:5-methylcytosine-specific restriction endonuclease McrA